MPMTRRESTLADITRQVLQAESLLGATTFLPSLRSDLPRDFTGRVEPSQPGEIALSIADQPPSGESNELLEAMDHNEVRTCRKCPLAEGRTNTVFGEGNPQAELVFVGEGPGAEEDRQGRPFVGRAGDLLTKMILAMGLSREDVFICNVVKCRPPSNRTPAPEEVQACWGYLVRQLQIIRPKVIVTLGNPATKTLLDTRTGITRMRGQFHSLPDWAAGLGGIAVMPTFHPAYLLRQYTQENRGMVWSDLQQVMDRLGIKPSRAPQQPET